MEESSSVSESSFAGDDSSENDIDGLPLPILNQSELCDLSPGKSFLWHKPIAIDGDGAAIACGEPDMPNKQVSIYHLLLDAELELTSDGSRIMCSKPLHNGAQSNKRRKRHHVSAVLPTGAALACPVSAKASGNSGEKSRAAVISSMETVFNSGEPERIRRFFLDQCQSECVLQLDLSKLGAKHGLTVYREIRGASGVASYFAATLQIAPDAVILFWQSKVVVFPDSSREIQAHFHMVGRQVYEMYVLDDEESHSEQEKLALAVAGLTSLFSSSETNIDQSGILQQDSSEAAHSSTSHLASIDPTDGHQQSSKKRKLRSLNDMSLLVAQGSVEFQRGLPLANPVAVNYIGMYTWVLDSDSKIVKMRFVLD